MAESERIYTVSSLNMKIKKILEGDPFLMDIRLKGEISNFRAYPSGHYYFSLKDEGSLISAAIWATNAKRLKFVPKDGDKVICAGSMNVYIPRGNYTFIADSIVFDGEGEELAKLRALAEKLRKEGLFDESRKKPIPAFPSRIGIIAGKGSAGMKDVIVNASRRYPLASLVMIPSLVQGEKAPEDLRRALELAKKANLDTLIIGRGGGSSEDLGAFNDEALVRAVASCGIPTISAVGHEIDTTLIDLVADLRVSTPTAAAVAATPDKDDLFQAIGDAEDTLKNAIEALLRHKREKLELLANRSFFVNPRAFYEPHLKEVAHMEEMLKGKMERVLQGKRTSVEVLSNRLGGLNPENVLKRGYAISENAEGKVIASIDDAKEGDYFYTHLKDGTIKSKVAEKARK